MTVLHFKGELIETDGAIATYRFFPDHVMAPAVSGVFTIDLKNFDTLITEPAQAESRGLVATDEHCVSALTHKIRKAFGVSGVTPVLEFFIS
jgi:hypothetical protein